MTVTGLRGVLMPLPIPCCTTPPPVRNLDTISYSERPPIRLDVREIEIQRSYQPPNAAPNVDHLFPVPPAAGAQLWAADRLKAAGLLRRARFIVREAPVIEIPLERMGGLTGTFTIQQSERYEARLVAELQILAEDDSVAASVTVEVEPEVVIFGRLYLAGTERKLRHLRKLREQGLAVFLFGNDHAPRHIGHRFRLLRVEKAVCLGHRFCSEHAVGLPPAPPRRARAAPEASRRSRISLRPATPERGSSQGFIWTGADRGWAPRGRPVAGCRRRRC